MKRLLVCTLFVLLASSGVLLWSQEWQLVATLSTDVSPGETLLSVDWAQPGTQGYAVFIESRDGEVTERGTIKAIYGNYLMLEERLGSEYLAGSKVYQ